MHVGSPMSSVRAVCMPASLSEVTAAEDVCRASPSSVPQPSCRKLVCQLTRQRRILLQLFSKSLAAMTVTVTGDPGELERLAHKVMPCVRAAALPECRPKNTKRGSTRRTFATRRHVPANAHKLSLSSSCSAESLPVIPQVAGGYRRPLPNRWPRELAQLLTECMAQDAWARPGAEEVRGQCLAGCGKAPTARHRIQMLEHVQVFLRSYCDMHTGYVLVRRGLCRATSSEHWACAARVSCWPMANIDLL